MIIIYQKSTGKILSSFPEIYTLPKGIIISGWDLPPEDFDQYILSPKKAYNFEDPRNPKNIHDYKVVNIKGKITLNKLG